MADTPTLAIDEAALLLGLDWRQAYRIADADKWPIVARTRTGSPLYAAASVVSSKQRRDKERDDSERERNSTRIPLAELLAFEEKHPGRGPRKENAIRAELPIRPDRYYQQLNAAVQTREALELNPAVVYRVRRLLAAAAARRQNVHDRRRAT